MLSKKHFQKTFTTVIICICLYACKTTGSQNAPPVNIKLSWALLENNYQNKPQFLASLTLANKGADVLPASGWKLYFNLRYHGAKLTPINSTLSITRVNGELFYISPTPAFKGIQHGDSVAMQFTGIGRIANISDVPSGFFWVDDKDENKAYAIEAPTVTTTPAQDVVNGAAIYAKNSAIQDIPEDKLPKIFPTPVDYKETGGSFILDGQVSVSSDTAFASESNYLSSQLKKLLGNANNAAGGKSITIVKKEGLANEAYSLVVTANNVTIASSTPAGAFYGIQSLLSLLPADAWQQGKHSFQLPCVTVSDAPLFPYRAFMIDVSRHFQPKEEILRLLDVMALYKLNTFHFHFTDDEGWRIEIPGLPELTEVGSQRGYPFKDLQGLQPAYGSGADASHSDGSGYYSVQDFIEILHYAAQRHIQVIPEIESPGHARAAVVSMNARYAKYMAKGDTAEAMKYMLHDAKDTSKYISAQMFNDNVMNAALPSTYRFVEKVVDEIQAMYKKAGVPLTMIHMGGDEVPEGAWAGSPAIQVLLQQDKSIQDSRDVWKAYFIRINTMLKAKGLKLYGWEELVTGKPDEHDIRTVNANNPFAKDSLQVDAWANVIGGGNEGIPYQLANTGYKVVLSCFDYYYFDLANAKGFDEPGDGWIGYLDVDKVFSFMPYNYYKNAIEDIHGQPLPANYFAGKTQLTPLGKKNIIGVQGAMWEENIGSPALFEYMLLPRMLALAERGWAQQPAWARANDSAAYRMLYNNSLSIFANVLGKRELPKLSYYNNGYNYRVPLPGAVVLDTKVAANILLPGFVIRYTVDGSVPTTSSAVYARPIVDKGVIKLAAFDRRGRRSGVVAVKNK